MLRESIEAFRTGLKPGRSRFSILDSRYGTGSLLGTGRLLVPVLVVYQYFFGLPGKHSVSVKRSENSGILNTSSKRYQNSGKKRRTAKIQVAQYTQRSVWSVLGYLNFCCTMIFTAILVPFGTYVRTQYTVL